MKVRLEFMELAGDGGEFFLEMDCIPREKEEIWVDKELLPKFYFESKEFIETPMSDFLHPNYGFKVDFIEHHFDKEGQKVTIAISEAKF
jgi:hypothetical protein